MKNNRNIFMILVSTLILLTGCTEKYGTGEFELDEEFLEDYKNEIPTNILGLEVVSGCSQVEIIWDTVPRASSYAIYIGETLLVDGLTDPYYAYVPDHNDLTEYKVFATNLNGTSELASGIGRLKDIPATPTGFTATDEDFLTKIVLTWDTVELAEYYRIEVEGEIMADSLTNLTYTDNSVTKEARVYSLIAYSECGEAAAAVDQGIITQGDPPFAPANFSASDADNPLTVALTWDATEGAQYYKILINGELLIDELPGTDTEFTDHLATSTPQTYSLIAYNPFGESPAATDEGSTIHNLYPNGGFETGQVGTNWNLPIIITDDVYQGKYSLSIGNASKSEKIDLEPGKSYLSKFACKFIEGSASGEPLPGYWKGINMLFDVPQNMSDDWRFKISEPVTSTTWIEITTNVDIPPASDTAFWKQVPGETVQVELSLWAHPDAGIYYVDNISLIEITK
jgi:hypothetical protein